MLTIPANYYEDLGARFGLNDTELSALARHHLLFDRDEVGGTFRHAYTHAFRDGVFFELVERTESYAGFGAANAAVRMAAQRRAAAGGRTDTPRPDA